MVLTELNADVLQDSGGTDMLLCEMIGRVLLVIEILITQDARSATYFIPLFDEKTHLCIRQEGSMTSARVDTEHMFYL